jgi:hypothetical protein
MNGRIVHPGSSIAKAKLQPVGKQARVSQHAKDLLEDVRLEACKFGQATSAEEIEQHWVNMQMRMYDLASHIEMMERDAYAGPRTSMKF